LRAVRVSPLVFVGLALLPACSDDNTLSTPLKVSWLEWADSVTAGIPFGVRVYGDMGQNPASLRVRVTVSGDTLTIQPYSVEPPCTGNCPDIAFVYDTLVWVPALAATMPRAVMVRAPNAWEPAGPWPLKTFGTLTVSPDTVVQPLMRSVGIGSGFQDGLGCSIVTHDLARLVSADQSPPWAPGFHGFVYGRVDPVLGSPCILDVPVILVDSIAM
jgi:hypothetical protein